ncbi:hypothetical protein [Streptomyces dysideae]|uniref:hypothetical protein n=1 Tax=Streptomyces dysideae TaxID=909626 RepID=UPI00131CBF76|nr:hypothetical protein [Streptomyces dysideae]
MRTVCSPAVQVDGETRVAAEARCTTADPRPWDSSWSAAFTGGFITYVFSNQHVVINVIDLVAL